LYDFLTSVCKTCYKFVINESYQICSNICKPRFILFYKYPSKQSTQNESKKLVAPENIGKKLQVCKRYMLKIFVNYKYPRTNICNFW
jgi:hypothetical protein